VWNTADGKRIGELDSNPLPISDQLAAAEKRVTELQKAGSEPSPNLRAAEAAAAKAAGEMDEAGKTLEQARAEQTAKENEVVRLKAEAAKNPPPADITAQLASARAVRAKARQAVTNALEVLQSKEKQVAAAKEKGVQARAENPAEALAAARALVDKLK